MAHTIINWDRSLAGKIGHMEHVQATVDLDQGRVGVAGGNIDGEREVRKFTAVADVETQEILMVSGMELMYEEYLGLKEFYNKANKPVRAFRLMPGDIITLTEDAFAGTPEVGKFVHAKNGDWKLQAAATEPLTPHRFMAEVIEETTLGADETTAYAIRVIRS